MMNERLNKTSATKQKSSNKNQLTKKPYRIERMDRMEGERFKEQAESKAGAPAAATTD